MSQKIVKISINPGLIFGWFFSILFMLGSIFLVLRWFYVLGTITFLFSLLLLPPANKFTSKNLRFEISIGVKIIIGIILFMLISGALIQILYYTKQGVYG